ncbi:MAG: hypothetical protein MUF87_19890 [Anaerolineae bacterium]|jgi:hypothetical protein|nr:hypothetical protein [Anaerolineae bacterium]
MSQPKNDQTLFVEMFPIEVSKLPQSYAYRLDINGSDRATVGGKLSYRLKKKFNGHWAWAGGFIVTDKEREISDIMEVIKTLWTEQPDTFKNLRGITPVTPWQPDARTISEFVARGFIGDIEKSIQQILAKKKQDLGKAVVERVYDIRGWVVDNVPALSVSISSRLVLKEDLKSYATRVSQDQLIGLQVADHTSTFKGEITEIVGTLATERQRLLAITQREEMQKLISSSPDGDLVVKVSNGRNSYDYAIGALRIILYMEYLKRFGINSSYALKALHLAPAIRADIVKDVSKVMKETQYVGQAYNSRNNATLFQTLPHTTQVKFGNGRIAPYSEKTIMNDLRNHGLYRVLDKFKNRKPIQVGILNALENQSYTSFWENVEKSLRSLKFDVHKVGELAVKEASRAELETAITQLQNDDPDIIVAFFPEDFVDEDDDETAYHHLKSLTIGRGIPSQVIESTTLENEKSVQSSVANIVLGILGKIGNIPYILAKPLEFADVIVGIDIARDKKKRLSGSINATAIARIYLSDGDFLQYVIHDAPLEGETIPSSVLQALFPKSEFADKRVVIQRDGYFRGDEKKALIEWATKIGATFHLVEVIKSGSPRIYANEKQIVNDREESIITQAQKGSAFIINSNEALIISTLPPFKNATPQPLHLRSDGLFPIEHAIESVLVMTNLHYGSVRPPRLPVTIHYSDKIAYLALRGIKPKNLEGNIPFWL